MRSSIASCIAAFGIVAAPIFAQPTSSPVQRISAADFAALPIVEKPLLSPDGHKIAALHTQEGKTTILIFDADHPEAPPKGMPINKTSVFALRWAGNRRLLLTIKLTQSMGDFVVPYLRLVSIDVGGDGGVTILDKKSDGVLAGDVLYTDPTGSWALVASQSDASSYPSVKRVDLATGAATVVEKDKEGIWDWYADDQGVVRAGVSYTDHHWKIWYRDKPGEPLQVIKGKTDENDDSAVDKFIFRGDESWVVTNEKTGRFGLYRYDTKNGGIGSAIFESPDVDVKDVNYDHATGRVKAVAYEDDRPRYKWLDAESSRLQERLDKALPQAANLPIGR